MRVAAKAWGPNMIRASDSISNLLETGIRGRGSISSLLEKGRLDPGGQLVL